MERNNLIEQAQALNAAVAVIKEYCDGRTADDACRKCLFRDAPAAGSRTAWEMFEECYRTEPFPTMTNGSGRKRRDKRCR